VWFPRILSVGRRLTLAAVAALAVPYSTTLSAQTGRSQLLERDLGFGRIEMMALEGGRTVVKLPPTDDDREVVVVGAIRVGLPLAALVDCFREAESFFAGDGIVTQIGLVDGQPSVEQLKRLRLPESDFEALTDCEVGDCKVKLTEERIEAFRAIDWSNPTSERLARTAMTEALTEYLGAYLANGNAALPVYHDKSEPLASAEDFARLHRASFQYLRHAPRLWSYMNRFPERRWQEVEDRFLWMVEDFGLRPVTSVNHMMIFHNATEGENHATIVVKQIYASHYLQGRVKVATLIPASERYPRRGTYLLLTAQLRFDGKVGGLKRALLERRLENAWTRHLMTLRDRAEDRYRHAAAASLQND